MSKLTKNLGTVPYENIKLSGQRVLLVGGGGFIGHHLALELKRKNAEVMVVDHLQINNISNVLVGSDFEPIRRRLYINFILERFELDMFHVL